MSKKMRKIMLLACIALISGLMIAIPRTTKAIYVGGLFANTLLGSELGYYPYDYGYYYAPYYYPSYSYYYPGYNYAVYPYSYSYYNYYPYYTGLAYY